MATAVWGGSFVVTHAAVHDVAPLFFVGCRFVVAALLVSVLTRPDLRRTKAVELRAGMLIGLAMLGGYALQAVAMHQGIDSGRAAFISAVYVPVVPLLQLVLLRRAPSRRVLGGLALACAGLALMAGPGARASGGVAPQLLVLAGAFCIAAEITLVGLFAGRVDPRRLAIIECATLGILSLAAWAASGAPIPQPRLAWIASAAGLGLASACLQISVNWAQRSVDPARATLIYTMEPVWAALFGALAGERMGALAIAGAVMILGSVGVSAERPDRPT